MSSKKEDAFAKQIGRGMPQTTLDKISQPVPLKAGKGSKAKKRD